MTKEEWLEIGFSKNIIDLSERNSMSFQEVYQMWFCMKMKKIKAQSLDRIECAFNRWYVSSDIVSVAVDLIDEKYVYEFLNRIIIDNDVTHKEFTRIYQIVNNVLIYAFDMGYSLHCVNFEVVKKYIAYDKLSVSVRKDKAVSDDYINVLFDKVINERIYSEKQCECLLWLLNFYLGLRIGELSSLRFSDFDLSARLVHVRKTQVKYHNRDNSGNRTGTMSYDVEDCCKTAASVRDVPLCDNAVKLYCLILQESVNHGYHSDYLAFDGKDVILTRSMSRCLSRLFQLCELEHCKSHYIRKTVATQLHNNNVPTRVISDILGHADITTTEKYYIVSTKNYSKYIEYMNNSLYRCDNAIKKKCLQ